jgi:hypothetical protein
LGIINRTNIGVINNSFYDNNISVTQIYSPPDDIYKTMGIYLYSIRVENNYFHSNFIRANNYSYGIKTMSPNNSYINNVLNSDYLDIFVSTNSTNSTFINNTFRYAYFTNSTPTYMFGIPFGYTLFDITNNQYLWTSTGPGNDEYNITLAPGQEVQIQDYGLMVLNINTTDPACSDTYSRTEVADPSTPWCTLAYACDQRLGGDVLILDGVSGAQTMCPTTVLGWGSEFDPFAIIVPFFGLIIVLIFGIVIYKAFQGDELDLDFLKDNLMQILLIGLMLCIAIILFGAIASLIISYL